MSTVEVKMFSLVCDGCGVDANEDTDFVAYMQEFASREIATDNGWLLAEDGKDWCPECCEWDENGDELKPRDTVLLAASQKEDQ
jgi:hypothetical protein